MGPQISTCSPAAPEPKRSVGDHVVRTLEELWRAYRRELKKCRRDYSSESVHQLRVRTRRLLAKLDLVQLLLGSSLLAKVRRTLKRRLKALGDLRDAQVQLAAVKRKAKRAAGLKRFRAFLTAREKRLKKLARRKVNRWRAGKLGGRISGIRDELFRRGRAPATQAAWGKALQRGLSQAFGEVLRRKRSINPSDLRTIHQTRVAFKQFRYMAESMPPELRGAVRATRGELAAYQRKMGEIQDAEVLMARLEEFCALHSGEQQKLNSFRQKVSRRRDRLAWHFAKSANTLEALWQPALAGSDTKT